MLQIQSALNSFVNSKRLWEKGVKWHQCFRFLTLPSHEGFFTTRDITEKTIVGSHLGDRFVKVCKTCGVEQILRLYNKKENSLNQTYKSRWFFVSVFCFTLSFTVDIPTVFTNCSPSTYFLLLTSWPTYFPPASHYGAKKETECPPEGSKQRNRQFFLSPQGCCIVGEDILLTVGHHSSFV
jgi:hypothetical protein